MSEERVHWLLDGNYALCGADSSFKPYKNGEVVDGIFHRFTECQVELVNCEECVSATLTLAAKVEISALELTQAAKTHYALMHAFAYLTKKHLTHQD
jgi:hypothetical protein